MNKLSFQLLSLITTRIKESLNSKRVLKVQYRLHFFNSRASHASIGEKRNMHINTSSVDLVVAMDPNYLFKDLIGELNEYKMSIFFIIFQDDWKTCGC